MKSKQRKIVIGVVIALIGMITTYMAVFAPRQTVPTQVGNIVASEDNAPEDTTTPKPDNTSDKPEQSETDVPKIVSNAYKVAQMLSNGDYAYTLSGYEKLEKLANDHDITLDDSCKVPFIYSSRAGYIAVASMNKSSTYTQSGNTLNVSNTIIHGIISSKEAEGNDDTLKSIAIDSLENLDNQDAHTDVVNYVIDLSSDGTSATIKCLNPEVFTK
jgi:hypothetical protein